METKQELEIEWIVHLVAINASLNECRYCSLSADVGLCESYRKSTILKPNKCPLGGRLQVINPASSMLVDKKQAKQKAQTTREINVFSRRNHFGS